MVFTYSCNVLQLPQLSGRVPLLMDFTTPNTCLDLKEPMFTQLVISIPAVELAITPQGIRLVMLGMMAF